ncbi:Tyrosine recombinase XerD [termite gut metagenome]|uniref:Tyrosine recombinase XerD n=1 Tax=termite gut metagenome TaxID=433724 RepID=A0A5J4QTY0_9ZZZZ
MNNELKVSFYLKRECRYEKIGVGGNDVYPIIGKIIIGKTIAQFSTKLKVEERLWHVKSGRVAGKSHAATSLNREINKINLSIHTHYKEILERTGKVTAAQVKNAFQGIATAQKTLIALFEEMMQEFHSRIGIDRAASTYTQHEVLHKQLKSFLREKYQVEDIPLSELDLPFIEAFNYYLRVKRKMKPGTVRARIVLLNKVIRQALHRNFISCPPFEGFGLEKPQVQNRSLSAEELNRLISTPIKSPTQSFIRDLFIFSTFTGISYADLRKLSWKDIITEEDGSRWISTDRQKTKTTFHVKLLNIPVQIMERYRGLATGDNVFPSMSLGQVNVGLKKVAKKCDINRTLTFHMSRHTFATTVCLSQGVPIETLSQMLGHQDITTTQIYAKVTRTKINEDMTNLAKQIEGKYELAK